MERTVCTNNRISDSVFKKFQFFNGTTVSVKNNKKTVETCKRLTGSKKYYVRVRTYKELNGKTYYSAWSAAKTVTTKK